MDKELAREVVRAVFRCGSELELLLPPIKERCTMQDYKYFGRQVAMAVDGVQVALLNPILKRFPELRKEIETNLARTGRAMP